MPLLQRANALAVYCHELNPAGSWFAHGASAHAIFEMTGRGVASNRGSWCAKGLATRCNPTWRLIGDSGTILWDGQEEIKAERVRSDWDGGDPAAAAHAPPPGDDRKFVPALETGAAPSNVVSDKIHSLAMIPSRHPQRRFAVCIKFQLL